MNIFRCLGPKRSPDCVLVESKSEVESQSATVVPAWPPIVFAFGPKNTFFFRCRDFSVHDDCGQKFRAAVQDFSVSNATYLSLGPSIEEFFVIYEDPPNGSKYWFKYKISSYLKNFDKDFKKVYFVDYVHASAIAMAFTPDERYVGITPQGIFHQANLPSSLETAITSRKKSKVEEREEEIEPDGVLYPDQVSLGCEAAWFLHWPDGVCAWDLGTGKTYLGLEQLLGSRTSYECAEITRRRINYLILDPWNPQHWFCTLDHATRVEYSMTKRASDMISKAVNDYMESMATVSTTDGTIEATPAVPRRDDTALPKYEHTSQEKRTKWFAKVRGATRC